MVRSVDLESYLSDLNSIRGYRASGVMSFSGQMLASNSIDPQINLEILASIFNDTFLVAHEVSTEVNLQAANEIIFKTDQEIIIIICSGIDAKAHIHLLAVLYKDGNLALARMVMEKLLSKLMVDDVVLKRISAIQKNKTNEPEVYDLGISPQSLSLESTQNIQNKETLDSSLSKETVEIGSSADTVPIQPSFNPVQVLVVHDSAVIGKKLELEFDKINIQPDFADSIERATKLINRKNYDIVFSGTNLSDGNGYQICRMIKRDPLKKHWIIILLSGNPSPYERVRSKLAGYDGYCATQNANGEKLANLIKSYLK